MNWMSLYLSLDGRIGRKEFWLGAGVLIVVNLMANLIPVLGLCVSAGLILPWTSLLVKRLHDFGRPGRMALIALVPALGSTLLTLFTVIAASNIATLGLAFASAGLALAVASVAMILALGFVIWVGVKVGDDGANAYGPVRHWAFETGV